MVALLVASRIHSLRSLALRCPLADLPEILRQRYGRVAIELWRRVGTVPASIGQVPFHSRFYGDCLRHDAYKAAAHVSAPTLIVHGSQDELIPLGQVQRIFDSLKTQKHLELITGADHRFSRSADFSRMTETLVPALKETFRANRESRRAAPALAGESNQRKLRRREPVAWQLLGAHPY